MVSSQANLLTHLSSILPDLFTVLLQLLQVVFTGRATCLHCKRSLCLLKLADHNIKDIHWLQSVQLLHSNQASTAVFLIILVTHSHSFLVNYSKQCIALHEITSALREITCHVGSHSLTCHPAAVTVRLTPDEAGTRFSDPGGMQGCVDLGGGYNSQDSLPAGHLSQK